MQDASSPGDGAPFFIGTHWTRLEGPIVFVRPKDTITLADNQALFAWADKVKREYGRVYLLIDGSLNANQEPAARAWASKNLHEGNRPSGTVVFGANYGVRVLITLFNRAAQLITRFELPLEFVATEAQARAYLARLDEAFAKNR